jgi:hypothetical protein
VIYSVIPREWVDDLYDKMVAYYADNPDVTVIVDRREGGDRRSSRAGDGPLQRDGRERRRARLVGTFPTIDLPNA